MPVETLFSPTTLLWLVGAAIAVAILIGSINRRRSRLTETLRDYVDRNQVVPKEHRPDGDPTSEE
jgi:beta-lactamase regulating signal transducer with metallopeptidase domain